MRNSKIPALLALLLTCSFAGPSSGQQPDRVFNWQPGNQEDVRLDPGNYHAGQTYHAGGGVKVLFASHPRAHVKGMGVRLDARVVVRTKGITFDGRRSIAPGLGASFFARF